MGPLVDSSCGATLYEVTRLGPGVWPDGLLGVMALILAASEVDAMVECERWAVVGESANVGFLERGVETGGVRCGVLRGLVL